MRDRDGRDQERADSPLRVAGGLDRIDTTDLSPDEVVEQIAAELPASGGSPDGGSRELPHAR